MMTTLTRLTDTLTGLLPSSNKAPQLAEALLADHEAERLRSRHALHGKLLALRQRSAALTEARSAVRAEQDAEIERRKRALQQAVEPRQRDEAAFSGESLNLSQECGRIEVALQQSASPLFVEFSETLETLIKDAVEARDAFSERTVDGRMRVVWSNSDSIRARIQAIHEARNETLRAWVLEPWTDSELAARFTELCEALPAIEQRPAKYRYGASDAA